MDQLNISGLKVSATIGVHPWEQAIKQSLLIDLSIPCQVADAQDELSQVLDYAAICQAVAQFIESQPFQLIETVANRIAELVKKQFGCSAITVTVAKPHAIPAARQVAITVNR